ncbi:HNH endonuclease [Erythrobacteraceae bacterium CFH 75059]|uniref:HNH endonuclease n=1 Tax=Qipengyuania thermophila TaxID=2509361 RepID=UPI00101ECD89|nr:HNH endonuclease signature motif containing protein [Qipengyuania thermophila]TCD04266.1 HNH endonuclease [Erythrobacteraceae bacterium CFH 75059]
MPRLKTAPHRLSIARPYRLQQPQTTHERDAYRNDQPWRKWYNTARWRRLRWSVLVRDRFTCQLCGRLEGDTARLVADHTRPHRGDERLFWDEYNLQCLCAPCHSGVKQRQEQGHW